MIKGYETKDVKASKTKAKPVEREEGVIFKDENYGASNGEMDKKVSLLKNLQK